YPQTRRTFVPKGVLTKTCLINPVRPNGKRAVHTVSTTRPISTARPVSTARPFSTTRPFAPKIAQTGSAIRPIYPRMNNGNPEICLQDHAVVDSSFSSHMTGNKAYLSDYEDYNGGFVAFGSDPKRGKITGKGKIRTANLDFDDVYFVYELLSLTFSFFKLLDKSQVVLRAPRQNGVYSLDLKNIVPSGGITCLYANATIDESKLWHRRLGHVNFKYMYKLVKGHLVRGLPSKVFVNDHTCVACKKGKKHKASCKAKLKRTIRKPLELLHMDLLRPVSVEIINKKKYCLVVTDDFSRFSWVFFLATKDETNEILYKFITGLENQLNHKVKIIRSDHGTEFKNHAMNEFCAKKGIKREFSVARTPQQNGVAERKNRTLIEAARTMLADSLLPIPFWAEAVNTACYVLNRVLVTKPQNKTPYELLIGKPPSISFMRPFGCPLTILNTLDPLGKFDGKSDEGYLLGYSTTSKAFRVYNKRTKRVEENMHIDFLEDQPNVAGSGPDWMFDLDFLTNTMNYIPVSVENQVNVDAGTQEHYVAGSSEKDKEPTQEYILLPLHPYRPRILVEDVVQAAQEKPSEDFPKDNDVQDSEDVAEKEEQHMLTEADQALKDDLERMIAQEIAAKAMDDATRQAFEEEKKREAQATNINKLNTGKPSVSTSNSPLVSTANTPYASAASTLTGVNTGGSSFIYLGGQIPIDASTLPNADLPINPNMPDLEDDSNAFPNDGIFSGAYDDEDMGVETDFNNMDNTIDVSSIPTLRVHKDHPKDQILRDPKSAVQTRGKIQKASSVHQALVRYIYNQNRTNHKDNQNCLLACFLSQEEPKTISQALEDESWVEAMQEELLQFKLQKVWILVDLLFWKKAVGTKWVFRNKRDERRLKQSGCFNPLHHSWDFMSTKWMLRMHFFMALLEKRTSMDLRMDGSCADLKMANLRNSDKHNMVAFLKKPTESVGFTEMVYFLKGTSLRTLANGIQELVASVDNKEYTITEASIRSQLQLADATGIINLSDAEIYEGLATLGGYVGEHVPLLPAMLASVAEDQGEGSAIPAEPHHTPIDPIPSTSQPSIPSTTEPPHSSPPRSIDRQNTKVPQPQGPTITFVADVLQSQAMVLSSSKSLDMTGMVICLRTHPNLGGHVRACLIDFREKVGDKDSLPLVEFFLTQNMLSHGVSDALFEALYDRKCQSPVCWAEVGDAQLTGPEIIHETMEKII
ncbi:putative ribonuclease H-like domain-containing protein, partial [Tanacetum coccineum]